MAEDAWAVQAPCKPDHDVGGNRSGYPRVGWTTPNPASIAAARAKAEAEAQVARTLAQEEVMRAQEELGRVQEELRAQEELLRVQEEVRAQGQVGQAEVCCSDRT